MSKVSIKGVLIGGIVDIVMSVVLGIPFAIHAMSKLDLAHTPKDQIGSSITAVIHSQILRLRRATSRSERLQRPG